MKWIRLEWIRRTEKKTSKNPISSSSLQYKNILLNIMRQMRHTLKMSCIILILRRMFLWLVGYCQITLMSTEPLCSHLKHPWISRSSLVSRLMWILRAVKSWNEQDDFLACFILIHLPLLCSSWLLHPLCLQTDDIGASCSQQPDNNGFSNVEGPEEGLKAKPFL